MEQLTAAQQAAELNKKNLFATYNHIEAEFVEPDHAIFKLEIRPESKNPYGIVHGGAIYTMADNATGYAAHTDGRSYVTQGSSSHRAAARRCARRGRLNRSSRRPCRAAGRR